MHIDIKPFLLFFEFLILSVRIYGNLLVFSSLSMTFLSLTDSSHFTKESPSLISIENNKDFYKFF